jgi:hypothetical protein
MSQGRRRSRRLFASSVGVLAVVAAAAGALSIGVSSSVGASKTVVVHARPHAARKQAKSAIASFSDPVTAVNQQFQSNTTGFCPAGSGNAPCDGNGGAGDYGTIDLVSSGFSNGGYGNYAPATAALYKSKMAIVSGTGDGNQGAGCPGTAVEECTGPYALFGDGAENVFPASGFTVTDDLYLSPSTAEPAGSLIDDDVEVNDSTGGYGIDNIITACAEPTSPGGPMGFVINFGNNSPGSCSGTPVITSDGWYRFVFNFSNTGGYAYVTEYVYSDGYPGTTTAANKVANSSPEPLGGAAEPIGDWGGPGYFWLPTEQISGVPLANFALQLNGRDTTGHTP